MQSSVEDEDCVGINDAEHHGYDWWATRMTLELFSLVYNSKKNEGFSRDIPVQLVLLP